MFRKGDEPIPRYLLQAPLGEGQFGAVWKARAPGGAQVALKFIDLKGSSGFKEYRGIQRVLPLRHSHLVPMTAIFLLDADGNVLDDVALQRLEADARASGLDPRESESDLGATLQVERPRAVMLVVAMALGDKTLTDRLEECQQQLVADLPENERRSQLRKLVEEGRAGLPLHELLTYIEEAAKGIDFLNRKEHQFGDGTTGTIQHCDIKPANIMLVGDSAQVCDFGLARELASGDTDIRRTQSGIAGSPLYMAPECIAGPEPSHATDQYSLAISYFELRTGDIPFGKSTKRSKMAILAAHAQGKLDLSTLPAAESRVIARATSIDPAERYPTCRKFVRELRKAVKESTGFDEDDSVRSDPASIPASSESSLMDTAASKGSAHETEPALTALPVDTTRETDELLAGVDYPVPTIDGSSFSKSAVSSAAKSSEKQPVRLSSRSWMVGLLAAVIAVVAVSYFTRTEDDTSFIQRIDQYLTDDQFDNANDLVQHIGDPATKELQRLRVAKAWRERANRETDPVKALEILHQLLEALPDDTASRELRADRLKSLIDASEECVEQDQLEAARSHLTTVFASLEKVDDPRNAELERQARLAEAFHQARSEPTDWQQVATKLEPVQAEQNSFSPQEYVRFQALDLLAQSGSGSDETLTSGPFLEGLVAARELESELSDWEQDQLATLTDRALDQLVLVSSLPAKRRKWAWQLDSDAFLAKLMTRVDTLRSEEKWGEARQVVDTVQTRPGRPATEPRVDRMRSLIQLEDPETNAGAALESFARSIVSATDADSDWLREACTLISERVDREPQILDQAIERLEAARRRFRVETELARLLETSNAELSRKRFESLQERTESLRKRIVAGPEADSDHVAFYMTLLDECSDLRERREAGESDPLIDACYSECLIQTKGDQGWSTANDESQAAFSQMEAQDSAAGFVHYVRALVMHRNPLGAKTQSAADHLRQALDAAESSPWAVQSPHRQQIAATILIEGAKAMRKNGPVPDNAFAPARLADAAKLLALVPTLFQGEAQQRSVLEPRLHTDWLLNYVLVQCDSDGFNTEEVDFAKVRVAMQELAKIETEDETDDNLHLVLARAWAFHRDNAESGHVRAVQDYAEVLGAMPRRIRGRGAARQWYDRIVAPAVKLALEFDEPGYVALLDDEVRAALAAIYAAKGQLILQDVGVRKFFERGHGEAQDTFSKAANLSPKAEYFVGQCEALSKRDDVNFEDTIAQLEFLTSQALALDAEYARALGWRGYAMVLQSRNTPDRDERRRLLDQAIGAYEEAMQRSEPQTEDRFGIQVGRSDAHLASAFLSNDDPTKLAHLTSAEKDAEAATKIDVAAQPEYAWIALGNAHEDMAWYLQMAERFPSAISSFERAALLALGAGRSRARAYMSLGRCRYRYAMNGGLQGAVREGELDAANAELRKSINESGLRAGTYGEPRAGMMEAEAHYWISCVYRKQNKPENGFDEAAKAAELAKQFDPISVPKYQTQMAELAYAAGNVDQARQMASQVIQVDRDHELDPDVMLRGMIVMMDTALSLDQLITSSNDYLDQLSGNDMESVARRLQLRLRRGETIAIVSSTTPLAARYFEVAKQDAERVLKQTDVRDGEATKPAPFPAFRTQALYALGCLKSNQFIQLQADDASKRVQKIGLESCEHLERAIPHLAKDPARDTIARIAFAKTTVWLLANESGMADGVRRKLNANAKAMLSKVIDSKTIDKNSADYQIAVKFSKVLDNVAIKPAQ